MNTKSLSTNEVIPMGSISTYHHWFICMDGGFEISGNREPTNDEAYALICAEIKGQSLTSLENDTLDLLFWAACQNIGSCSYIKTCSSIFFGPSSVTKDVTPPKRFFILTKRDSASYLTEKVSVISEGNWTINGCDWFIRVSFTSTVKKLTALEISDYSKHKVGMYMKTDKYSPYHLLSSVVPE